LAPKPYGEVALQTRTRGSATVRTPFLRAISPTQATKASKKWRFFYLNLGAAPVAGAAPKFSRGGGSPLFTYFASNSK